MSSHNEFLRLLYSDVSGAAVDQLTSVFGLWVRNTLIHFGAGFAAYFVDAHAPRSRPYLLGALLAYVFLQIVQVGTARDYIPAMIDGIWDVVVVLIGLVVAIWLTAREVSR